MCVPFLAGYCGHGSRYNRSPLSSPTTRPQRNPIFLLCTSSACPIPAAHLHPTAHPSPTTLASCRCPRCPSTPCPVIRFPCRAALWAVSVSDDRLGITMHTSLVRFQGTLYGSVFGYLAVTGTYVGRACGWSGLASFGRREEGANNSSHLATVALWVHMLMSSPCPPVPLSHGTACVR